VAAAAAAAHGVLVTVVPSTKAQLDAQLASDLSALGSNVFVATGQKWGDSVAQQVVAARAADGSSREETGPGGTGPGQFRTTWAGAQFRNLEPFAIVDPAFRQLPALRRSTARPLLNEPYSSVKDAWGFG
jgi:hypothetical protein